MKMKYEMRFNHFVLARRKIWVMLLFLTVVCAGQEERIKGDRYVKYIKETDEKQKSAQTPLSDSKKSGSTAKRILKREIDIYSQGIKISGTLTLPVVEGVRPPVVILVAGSGPTDRDWNSKIIPGTNGSGKLIANYLAGKGYAVFRYDKRGVGRSSIVRALKWNDYLVDLITVIDYIKEMDEVDGRSLYLLGNSEGGLHVLQAAIKKGGDLKGIVLLGCPGRKLSEILKEQFKQNVFQPDGLSKEQIDHNIDFLERAFTVIYSGKNQGQLKTDEKLHQTLITMVQTLINPINIEYIRGLIFFDPKDVVRKINVPVLILQGAKDIQVSLQRDGTVLYETFRFYAHPNVKFYKIANANHIFKYESTPADSLNPRLALKYNMKGTYLDPDFELLLLDWLNENR